MPCIGKVYYRSPLPQDLMKLLGQFAGDDNRRLEFTITPTRKYLGKIRVHSPFRSYTLRKCDWSPKQLAMRTDVERVRTAFQIRLLQRHRYTPEPWMSDLQIILDVFEKIVCQVQDYRLR